MTVDDALAIKSVGNLALSPDAKQVVFVVTTRNAETNKNDSEVWVVAVGSGESRRLTYHEGTDRSPKWHPGSDWIAFISDRSGNSQIWGIDPAGGGTSAQGAVYLVTPGRSAKLLADMPGRESPADWSRDHGLILSGSGHALGTFNSQLWRVDLSTGNLTSLTAGLDENARLVTATPRGLLLSVAQRTGSGLMQIPIVGGKPSSPQGISDQSMFYSGFSVSDDGSMVAFLAESSSQPGEVFVSRASSWSPRRLSHINPQLSEIGLGEQRVVGWKSRADGEEIEGVLTLPVGYRSGVPVPLLLVIHGGPPGVSSNRFLGRPGAYPVQVFAGLGYAVLQPNYRGSTGYGE